jgi:hypothetical protein
LKNGFKVEGEPVPERELSTLSSSKDSTTFWCPLGDGRPDNYVSARAGRLDDESKEEGGNLRTVTTLTGLLILLTLE